MGAFDKDEFVAECLGAVGSGNGARAAVKDIVDRTVSDPLAIEAEVRPRTESPMMTIWHRSDVSSLEPLPSLAGFQAAQCCTKAR